MDLSADTRVRRGGEGERSISYLPVLPPVWAELPTDQRPYQRPSPDLPLPATFLLDKNGSCSQCTGTQRTFYDEDLETTEEECKVYSQNRVTTHRIVLQKCRSCPGKHHRSIGPDLRELGVFNHNNTALYTHDLLDEYTSEYTTSNTPFVAWVKVVSRRYAIRNCKFVGSRTFENAWFAYVQLQRLGERNMQCAKCGPSPRVVIWDGVTVAFSQSQLTEDLHPPTTLHDDAPVRRSRYAVKPQLIQVKPLRVAIRKIVAGPSAGGLLDDWEDSEEEADATSAAEGALRQGKLTQKEVDAKLEHLKLIAWASVALGRVNSGLRTLFDRELGSQVYEEGKEVKHVYKDFFNQVRRI